MYTDCELWCPCLGDLSVSCEERRPKVKVRVVTIFPDKKTVFKITVWFIVYHNNNLYFTLIESFLTLKQNHYNFFFRDSGGQSVGQLKFNFCWTIFRETKARTRAVEALGGSTRGPSVWHWIIGEKKG